MKKKLLIYRIDKGADGQIIPDNISRALNYINENFNKPMKLSQIATIANLSKYHFSRLFKKHVGCNPFDYITALRMDRAASLLTTSSLTVSEICYEVGYESPPSFCLSFKEWTGLYPADYRNKFYVTNSHKATFYELINLKKAYSE